MQGGLRALSVVAAAALALLVSGAAGAAPVSHDIVGSNVSGDVSGDFDLTVHSNVGTFDGSAMASGSLSSTPDGSLDVDWGDPGWTGNLEAAPGDVDIELPNPGTPSGTATIDLGSILGSANFDLDVPIDSIDLGIGSTFSGGTGDPPPVAGSGPWTALDTVDLMVGAQVDIEASGPFGINVNNDNISIGPTSAGSVPLLVQLERIAGDTGSRVTIPIPSGLEVSLPPQPETSVDVPGCEVDASVGCAGNITSIDVKLQSLDFTNLSGSVVAEQIGTVVPEPTTFGLLGLGLAGLGLAGRRFRH